MRIDYAVIGKRMKEYRKKLHMTQEQLAEKLDVSTGYISQMERGITKINLEMLAGVADVFACDIADLVSNSAYHPPLNHNLTEELHELSKQLSPDELEIVRDLLNCYIDKKQSV